MSFELFYNNKTQINDLIEKYKQGKLVLVLGAGLSKNFNVPDWNTLLKKLLVDYIKFKERIDDSLAMKIVNLFNDINKDNELKKGRFIQSIYERDIGNYALEESVRNLLYREIEIKNVDIINSIAMLIQSLKLDSVITYNYDDILEGYLHVKDSSFKVKSLYGETQNFNKDEFPIYHVHGFLPRSNNICQHNKITLGEKTYHEQYSDIYSSNNLVQITKFRENSCLFIGISLTDPNTRRLLDIANKKEGHYIFRKKVNQGDIENTINLSNVEDKEKSRLLYMVQRLFNDYESIDAYSFGVNTIWIDDYSDISKILQKIVREENIEEHTVQDDIIKDILIEEGLTKYDKYVKVSLKVEKPDQYGVFIGSEKLQYVMEKNFFHGLVNYTDNESIRSKINLFYIT